MNFIKMILHVNNYCNLSCEYCSSNIPYISLKNQHDELDIIKLPILLNFIKRYIPIDYFIEYIITGGETTLYKNIITLIKLLDTDLHEHKTMITTNSTIPFDNIFDNISGKYFTITYHYDTLKYKHEEYYDCILHNIDFLINNNNHVEFTVISKDKIDKKISNNISRIYNNKIEFETRIARNTEYYHLNNTPPPNKNYMLNRYIYRTIKVLQNFDFCYGCDIANKNAIIPNDKRHINLFSKTAWGHIQENLNKKSKCTLVECLCPSMCY